MISEICVVTGATSGIGRATAIGWRNSAPELSSWREVNQRRLSSLKKSRWGLESPSPRSFSRISAK
jgi:NADP-dependent 3-hydroxy acid dehydrogenase YdfG